MKYLRPTLGFLFCVLVIYLLVLHGEYYACRLQHRSDEHLTTSRERVKHECFVRLNPLFL